MPVIVKCPSCNGPLRVADELLGRKVRCPGCQTIFEASAPPPEPPPPPQPPPAEPAPRRNEPPAGDDLRPCPGCRRMIHRDSTRCYNCGERLVSSPRPRDDRRDERDDRRDYGRDVRRPRHDDDLDRPRRD